MLYDTHILSKDELQLLKGWIEEIQTYEMLSQGLQWRKMEREVE